jgi:hypothetical protein
MNSPIPKQTRVIIRCGKRVLEGVVLHCDHHEICYRIGVAFARRSARSGPVIPFAPLRRQLVVPSRRDPR